MENEKNSGDLFLILGVPTPKFRGTYLEGGGGSPRGEHNCFAFLDDSAHVKKLKKKKKVLEKFPK